MSGHEHLYQVNPFPAYAVDATKPMTSADLDRIQAGGYYCQGCGIRTFGDALSIDGRCDSCVKAADLLTLDTLRKGLESLRAIGQAAPFALNASRKSIAPELLAMLDDENGLTVDGDRVTIAFYAEGM